mmetsp:Transcript_58592/g.188331  ORF Transcript_58592/g.188331 Transcript_58592/m.188331 type:complete len:200 (+) Transcript_58592:458-1057(+)
MDSVQVLPLDFWDCPAPEALLPCDLSEDQHKPCSRGHLRRRGLCRCRQAGQRLGSCWCWAHPSECLQTDAQGAPGIATIGLSCWYSQLQRPPRRELHDPTQGPHRHCQLPHEGLCSPIRRVRPELQWHGGNDLIRRALGWWCPPRQLPGNSTCQATSRCSGLQRTNQGSSPPLLIQPHGRNHCFHRVIKHGVDLRQCIS